MGNNLRTIISYVLLLILLSSCNISRDVAKTQDNSRLSDIDLASISSISVASIARQTNIAIDSLLRNVVITIEEYDTSVQDAPLLRRTILEDYSTHVTDNTVVKEASNDSTRCSKTQIKENIKEAKHVEYKSKTEASSSHLAYYCGIVSVLIMIAIVIFTYIKRKTIIKAILGR